MRTDASVTNGDPGLGEPSRECPTAAQLVELLQTAYPINWEQLLRKRLDALGVADPADLTPAKLAAFRDHVFWSVKQSGIKDPAAWISHQAQVDPKAPAPKLRCPVQVEDTAGQSKSVERGPVAIENSPAIASAASALPSVSRTALYGTTKAEVLSRAKAAVEAGESPRVIAERLACAQENFHASQREIGRAIGQSASWVNRLLKWRQSGYNPRSPFGPTTRAGRAAHRNHGNNHTGGCGGAEQPENEGSVRLVGHSSPAYHTASPTPLNEILLNTSAQTEVLSGGEADGIEEEATQVESGGQPSEKQKLSARNAKIRRKLSPERMCVVIEALREYPILARAAAKAGIHRKTLEFWLKCSEGGQNGYDIEWEGFQWRFHEACEAAIDEAHQTLLDAMYDLAMGPITYKIDQDLVDLGMEGADAYARDENGDFIEEARGAGNVKMLERLLELLRPEKWGKARKRKIVTRGGVLVIGEHAARPEKKSTASIKVRQWKSASRMVGETKA
jgi:hypothetical protein